MPRPDLFRTLGLFVQSEFLPACTRSLIAAQMRDACTEKATIVAKGVKHVDETVRRVLAAHVDESILASISERLGDLKPRLEEHFQLSLSGFEPPCFLRYGEGAFYKVHKDTIHSADTGTCERRISLVIFLNGPSEHPSMDGYGGGSLAFYGLIDGPQWENCGLPLDPEAGLIVAFRSDIRHEVQPVTFGQRYTIVTWFK